MELSKTELHEGEYAFKNTSDEDLQNMAENYNCELVFPKDDELFLDIDSAEFYSLFQERIKIFEKNELKVTIIETKSKSGNWHITVKLPFDVNNQERVALQAALGSDWKRELLATIKSIYDGDAITCFFKPKK